MSVRARGARVWRTGTLKLLVAVLAGMATTVVGLVSVGRRGCCLRLLRRGVGLHCGWGDDGA
jgi:hypothetical protein